MANDGASPGSVTAGARDDVIPKTPARARHANEGSQDRDIAKAKEMAADLE
jgi:hypothetical protein